MNLPFKIQPFGETALLISWENKIDKGINAQVHYMVRLLKQMDGIQACIPAYTSVTVRFNLLETDHEFLSEQIVKTWISNSENRSDQEWQLPNSRYHKIPVCYGHENGPDLEEVASVLKLSPKRLVRKHTSIAYTVYMMGFLPGFGYLGSLPFLHEVPRKLRPRKYVEQGSVGLAGKQTGIYPSSGPGGWQLIGQTPFKMATVSKAQEWRFRLKAGDQVQFFEIERKDWEYWVAKGEAGFFSNEAYAK